MFCDKQIYLDYYFLMKYLNARNAIEYGTKGIETLRVNYSVVYISKIIIIRLFI